MKKKFAIIGNPISHSLSPILHNYWYKKYNIDAEYSLLNINEGEIKSIINKVRNKEITGLNITLPFKQKVIPHLDQLINDAKDTNSVNTLLLDEANNVVGENTDVYGLQAAYFKEITNAKSKKALIIGSGGVAPSVIFALKKTKIKNISIVNRTHEKAIFLKKRFNFLDILSWNLLEKDLNKFDIIINATSLGLKGGDDLKFNFNDVKESSIYIDTIYNPLETKTLKLLKEKNLKTFNGLNMFIYQGQKSFYLWNKINPEIDNELIDILISKLR